MRLALVPGFSQPASAWGAVIAALPASIRADAEPVEVPDGLEFAPTAAAIGAAMGIATCVGYSMGGRLALRLAIDRPELVHRLVLVSAGVGIRDAGERRVRAALDQERADAIHRLGVAAFLEDWVRQPLFATLPPAAAMVGQRAAAMTADRLAHQMLRLGQGEMEPVHDRLASIRVPTTVVVGNLDSRYTAIGETIATTIPGATLVRLDGGHALPLEAPAALAAVIAAAHTATA